MRLMMSEVCGHPTDAAEGWWRERVHTNFLTYLYSKAPQRKKKQTDKQSYVFLFLSEFECENLKEELTTGSVLVRQAARYLDSSRWTDDLF